MIEITDKHKCCGCTSCEQICPTHCITMQEDKEGFLYPVTNEQNCINCGRCESACPVLHPYLPATNKPDAFACKTTDELLRAQSSSGGIFSVLASQIISLGGIVFGACFMPDWSVTHITAETNEELALLRGSKYVQSNLLNTFTKIRNILKSNRPVLFSGTPCQVAGLNHFLKKKYDNLYTIDIVCHSIPSPKVWKMYLSQIVDNTQIRYITFRNKSEGWNNYGLLIKGHKHIIESGSNSTNLYMRGFLENLYVRPSCYACPARNYTSGSDIMLADCWGLDKYHPNLDDNKGMSQVLIITEKGQSLFNKCRAEIESIQIPYNEVEDHALHLPITTSASPHPYREFFFKHFEQQPLKELIDYCLRKNDIRTKRIMLLKNIGRLFALDKIYRIWKERKR